MPEKKLDEIQCRQTAQFTYLHALFLVFGKQSQRMTSGVMEIKEECISREDEERNTHLQGEQSQLHLTVKLLLLNCGIWNKF